jgi:hypothetical protein
MRLPTLFVFLAISSVVPANAGWLRLPVQEKKLVGMELGYCGTTLHSVTGIEDAASLIMGDLKKSAKLGAGKCEAVLRFSKQSFLQSLSFVNDDLEGRVFLSISTDAGAWTPLAEAALTARQRLVSLDVGRAQGRYVKISFELAKAGTLRGVQVLGSDSDANYIVMQEEGGRGAMLNFANGIGGGRLLYLNDNVPGAVKDAAQSNVLKFSAVGGRQRTAVYDLGQERSLKEFGSIHSVQAVGLAVYAFSSLPEKENWRGRPTFDPAALESAEPVAVARDATGRGYLTVRPDKEVKARFVALRWETEPDAGAFDVYGVSICGAASIFFQNSMLTATTYRDADGAIVTKLRQATSPEELAGGALVAGVSAKTGEADTAAARMFALQEARMGNTSGMMFPSFYQGGGGRPIGGGRGKDEGATTEGEESDGDPDEDPPAVHIIWCEEASP